MKLSVIIPTLNEADNMAELIPLLSKGLSGKEHEILVIDAGSQDETLRISKAAGAHVTVVSPKKGRSCQMNYGASLATGDVLYFVHADTRPPVDFWADIMESLGKGFPAGCYRSAYDGKILLMKFNAWLTRFDKLFVRGGDQSIFITKDLFEQLGGYRTDYKIMEDFEFLKRLRTAAPFRVIPREILISTRKYEDNSYLRVNLANIIVVAMYRFGASQDSLVSTYKRLLHYR
ncbi:MAG: TIGR04283 family arsenosugar biosynthesis glycosyltransferase [Bacteroidia bacterium]|nr:TIGR04283 family arsenosugar biosynthesis glycosyltransferase [Bacteroidia bacterium]